MKQVFNTKQSRTLISYFLLAIAVIIAYKVIQEIDIFFSFIARFFSIISPFISGFILAYILNIPCDGIQKLLKKTGNSFICRRKKMFGIIITYLLMFFISYLVLRLIIPSISDSISFFMANFQSYYNGAQDLIHSFNSMEFLNISISMDQILSALRNFGLGKLPSSINALFGVSSALFKAFLAFISSIYILSEKEMFKVYICRVLKAFLPETGYNGVLKYTRVLNNNFKQYIYTQTVDGCILGTLVTIEFYLFGSPYALLLGVMLGVVNYIPYFGSIIGSIVAVLVIMFTQSFTTGAIVAVILLITQQTDANFIQPRLMSGTFSLSPLLVIVCITIGGAFYGVLGMIAAIPIVAVIKNIFEEILIFYEKKKIPEPETDYKLKDKSKPEIKN